MGNNKERQQLIAEYVRATSRRHRKLWGKIDEAFKLEITNAQREALIAIADIENCHISDIANWLGVTNGAVTQLVDALEKHNLVKRQPDIHDARKVQVVLTDFGKEKLKEAMHYFVKRIDKMVADMSTEKLRTVLEVQNAILEYDEE